LQQETAILQGLEADETTMPTQDREIETETVDENETGYHLLLKSGSTICIGISKKTT